MLRPLLLSTLLLSALRAAAASAQDAAPEPPAPTAGQYALLAGGSVAGGLVTLPLGAFVGPLAALGVPAGTYLTSRALGLRPTVGGVLLDVAVGTVIGVGVAAGTLYYVTEVAGHPYDLSADLGSIFVGYVAGAAATGLAHGIRLTVLRAPAGERSLGLHLRIDL